jgi:hypothetical protein
MLPLPASDFPSSRAGDSSALWLPLGGFTASLEPAVPLSGAGGLLRTSRERLKFRSSSTFGPSRRDGGGTMASADSCRLNPASRLGLPSQTAWRQVSPGKNADFPGTLAPFTIPALDCIGLCGRLPTRPTGTASYGVRVPPVAGLPPASFRPRLAATPLPLANGWCSQPP